MHRTSPLTFIESIDLHYRKIDVQFFLVHLSELADHATFYSLSSGAFLLTFGKLADMFGRKSLFILGMAGFTIALLVAGFATNAIYMDVFSGILGLFAAAVVPPAVGALGAVYEKPSKRKNRAFACFSAGNPLGFVGGMIISGIASHEYNWRASFWALAVVYAIFTALTVWTVPPDGFARTPVTLEAVKRFDLLGTALVIIGFAFFSSSLSSVVQACLFRGKKHHADSL